MKHCKLWQAGISVEAPSLCRLKAYEPKLKYLEDSYEYCLVYSAVYIHICEYSVHGNQNKAKNECSWACRQNRLLEEEAEDLSAIPEGELCVVCFSRRRRAAFIICGHRVCCVGCAQRVERGVDPRCPVCRQIVTGTVRVFDS